VLRIVTGDGNGTSGSLSASGENNRNNGKVKVKRSHNTSGVTTIVWRGALAQKSTGDRTQIFLENRASNAPANSHHRFSFFHFTGNEGAQGSPCPSADCGKIGLIHDTTGGQSTLIHGLGVVPVKSFFTIRAICNPSGAYEVWVNENTEDVRHATGTGLDPRTASQGYQASFGPYNAGDETHWIDYVQVLEGAVPPPAFDPCSLRNPVFDQTGPTAGAADGKVDQQDLAIFESCYTGPSPGAGAFDALPDQCKCMDRNGDAAVDQQDFGFFQRCYTGSTATIDPACDDN
jgi:hypothetical protein